MGAIHSPPFFDHANWREIQVRQYKIVCVGTNLFVVRQPKADTRKV